ncbi:MAG: pyridoxamine 5'-phosphate oxidase family protein [Myxococcota bacterium]|nr:pyridoxamine 5'-phosphate oxidase family protein [Myxococcota bacterium]
MGDSGRVLSADLVEFFESGVSILVATRDARLHPACGRAMGAQVQSAARVVTVFIPEVTSSHTVANLRDNRRIAVTFARPLTHYAIQIKGTCQAIRASGEAERAVQMRYRAAYTEQLHAVGMPRPATARLVWWPSLALDVLVQDLFVQTPGPTAGRRLEA